MDQTIRIDKWLWAARFFKTRSLAADAVGGGKVHLNGSRVKPARDLKPGDTLDIHKGSYTFTVLVRVLSSRRGPAKEAVGLYEETLESIEKREKVRLALTLATEQVSGERPTKRDRRALDRIRDLNS